jgi:hypothetical protein
MKYRVGKTRFDRLVSLSSLVAVSAMAASHPPTNPTSPKQIQTPAADWVRGGLNTNFPTWGIRSHLLWGLPPREGPLDGPRGLIRLRYPTLTNGGYDLINFIAIEPVVNGRRGFSELERSQLDSVPGKRLSAGDDPHAPADSATNQYAGRLDRLAAGVESLIVRVGVERFLNGAHVTLSIAQRSDAPDEIELAIHAEPDSAPMDYCILTATMGNKARARWLWLKDGTASSLKLYPDYRAPDFAPHRIFALDRLHRTATGDLLAAITTDEADPAAVEPFPGRTHWRYAGAPVTQYWRKPAGAWLDDLHVAVNARYTYWLSRQPIPGGVAFENFELRERFHEGQRFIFGVTRKTPAELGFPAK